MPTISTGRLIRGHRDLALRKRHKTCVELMINKMKLNFSSEYVSEYLNCHSLSLFFPQLRVDDVQYVSSQLEQKMTASFKNEKR